jgi:hypothetical protein
MYPLIPWEMFADRLGPAEHILGTTTLDECVETIELTVTARFMTTGAGMWLPSQNFVAHLSNYLLVKKRPALQTVGRINEVGSVS